MRISDWSSDVCSSDLIWCETAKPDLDEARRFAEAIKKEYPDQLLSYNCSPSFNWKKNLDDATIAKFQRELSAMGYKHQFITLAGIHNMWHSMFNLAHDYASNDMTAYVKLQEQERSEEHTSELQSIMSISYAVFCLKKNNTTKTL